MTKKKTVSLDELKDKYIGPIGTGRRDKYEYDLSLDIIGSVIKEVRQDRKLTQEQLGKLIGVQRAQISKLEKNARNVTLATILKVLDAMKAKIKFNIEINNAA